MKLSINAIMKTLFFHVIKYDFKGHGRSHKAILANFFLAIFIYQPILIEICMNGNIMKR